MPSQLGLHFWPDFSRVLGLKIDYLSPTIYFTHLTIIFLLLLNAKKIILEIKKTLPFLTIFLTFSIFNVFFSINPILTIYKWLEVFLYLFLFLYIRTRKSFLQNNIIYLYCSLLLILIVQFFQIINQSSLGGLFYWLGERKFDYLSPHLPRYYIFNRDFVRVPSLFSHANSFAGFMFLTLISLKFLKSSLLVKTATVISVTLSGSKNILLFLPLYLLKKISIKKILILCLILTATLVASSQFSYPDYYTISSRLSGVSFSLDIIKNNYLFGTGLGSYLTGLEKVLNGSQITYENLQPVHNIYLLIISELGLLGFSLLLAFILKSKISTKQSLILSVVLLTGLFDHYWLTLVQNKTLITVLLASFPVEYET